jgi:hypothetical protein
LCDHWKVPFRKDDRFYETNAWAADSIAARAACFLINGKRGWLRAKKCRPFCKDDRFYEASARVADSIAARPLIDRHRKRSNKARAGGAGSVLHFHNACDRGLLDREIALQATRSKRCRRKPLLRAILAVP